MQASEARTNGAAAGRGHIPAVRETSPRTARERTAAELRATSQRQLLAYFRELEAPALRELNGEYAASLLDSGSRILNLVARLAVTVPARWLAKAFRPMTELEGEGYNSFRSLFGVHRRLRMRTFAGSSKLDGRPSYFLEYSAYNGGPLGTMVDEVRRVAPGRYLGIGRLGYTERQRSLLFPFLLEGPTAPFVER